MAQKMPEGDGEALVYGSIAAYLDDELTSHERKAFEVALTKMGRPDLPRLFGSVRGLFQLKMQDYSLDEAAMHHLRSLVTSDSERATIEATAMDSINKTELVGNLMRRLVVVGLFFAVVFSFIYWLTPPKKVPFMPLETLVYEAAAMEEGGENRLDFPTDSLAQANDYLRAYPDLGFPMPVLAAITSGWKLTGATVIDYDVAKIAALELNQESLGEKAYLFVFDGQLAQLPKAATGNYKGLLYQTYETNQLNVIAWQIANGVVGLMAAHRSAPEMADMARALSGL